MPGEIRKLPTSMVDMSKSGALSWRNKIINGNFAISQRGALAPSAGGAFIADRLIGWVAGASLPAVFYPPVGVAGISNTCVGVAGAAGNTAVTFEQRIEASAFVGAASKQFTFSAWVFSTAARNITVQLLGAGAKDNFAVAKVMVLDKGISIPAGTWTKVVVSTTAHNTEFLNGVSAMIAFGAHTAGSIFTTEWQLEEGTVATPFEHRPYGVELALCQRYYEMGNLGACCDGAMAYVTASTSFIAAKRTVPTVTVRDNVGNPNACSVDANNNVPAQASSTTLYGIRCMVLNSVRAVNNFAHFHWTADAEL